MRVLFHILAGAITGFATGILGPIALFAFMSWHDPNGMQQGGGTAIPFMMLLAAPLGAIYGAVWGYERASPPKTIMKHGPERVLRDFDDHFGHLSQDDQRVAMAEIAPAWMAEYRRWINGRLVLISLLSFPFLRSLNGIPVWFVLCGGYATRTLMDVLRVRSAVRTIQERFGDDAVDPVALHWTLRLLRRWPAAQSRGRWTTVGAADSSLPEPTTAALAVSALLGGAVAWRRRRRAA